MRSRRSPHPQPVAGLRTGLALVAFAAALALACGGCHESRDTAPAAPPTPASYFEDRTAGSGLAFTYRNGEEAGHYAILESLGGGVALLDYDGDGLLDIFLPGGGYFDGPDKKTIRGHPCKLYRNLGGWKFKDVTREVGLDALAGGRPWFYTHGCAVADYDNDGWPDLLITGYGRLALYHNEPDGKGGRRFVDVTARAGLMDQRKVHWSTSAAWGDLNGDGLPDLFVVHYVDWSPANHPRCPGYRPGVGRDVCSPKVFSGLPAAVYLNQGNGTFREASREAGLKPGKGLGVVLADLDDDGRLDVYVANDTTDNFLYLNQGKGRFREDAVTRGVAFDDFGVANGSM